MTVKGSDLRPSKSNKSLIFTEDVQFDDLGLEIAGSDSLAFIQLDPEKPVDEVITAIKKLDFEIVAESDPGLFKLARV